MSNIEDKEYRENIRLKVKNDYGIALTEDEITLCIVEQEIKKVSIFHNQIYPNKRSRKIWKGKNASYEDFISWDLTIDGARAIAHRHGLCGTDSPIFKVMGDLPDEVSVTVYRRGPKGERYPFTGEVRYEEFVQKTKKDGKYVPNYMWATKPFNQLAKCAEAQALRKGFQEIGDSDPFLVDLDETPTQIPNFQVVGEGDAAIENPATETATELVDEPAVPEEIPTEPTAEITPQEMPPEPEQREKTVDSARAVALPFLKRWCAEINNNVKVTWKQAYEQLVGVVLDEHTAMTVNDYEVLTSQLNDSLEGRNIA